jgi:hypothetical protein
MFKISDLFKDLYRFTFRFGLVSVPQNFFSSSLAAAQIRLLCLSLGGLTCASKACTRRLGNCTVNSTVFGHYDNTYKIKTLLIKTLLIKTLLIKTLLIKTLLLIKILLIKTYTDIYTFTYTYKDYYL